MAINFWTLQRSLTYQRSAPIEQLLLDVEEIAGLDTTVAAKRDRLQAILSIAIMGGGLSLGLFLFWGFVWLWAIPIGCAIIAIFAGLLRLLYGRVDAVDYRYALVGRILPLLGRDIDNDDDVDITLTIGPKVFLETTAHPHKPDWKIDRFSDDWLSIQGTFIDRTQFSLTATEVAIEHHGTKRNFRGKIKYKRKKKFKGFEIVLILTFPRRKYGAIAAIKNEAKKAIRLPQPVQLKTFRVKENSIYLKAQTPPWLGIQIRDSSPNSSAVPETQLTEPLYQTITMMFLSLYHVLNLANALAKKKT